MVEDSKDEGKMKAEKRKLRLRLLGIGIMLYVVLVVRVLFYLGVTQSRYIGIAGMVNMGILAVLIWEFRKVYKSGG